MFTRLGRVVTCRAGPQIQSQVIFLLWGHVTHEKNFYLHFHNTYGHQTWQTGNLRWGNPTFKVTSPFDYVVTWHMKKNYICTSAIPMFTKLGRGGNLLWRDPKFKVKLSFCYGVTWHMKKTFICTSTIPMATKLGKVVTYVRKTPPTKLRDLLIKWSPDKCKTLYLHFCNTYDYQTWLSGNLRWGTSPSKSRDLLIMRSCDTWKRLISALPQYLWPPNLAKW